MSEVTAQLNRLRLAPRKVRAISNLLKGKDVDKCIDQLEYFPRRSSPHFIKLINSGIANAERNFNMVKSNLYIKDIVVDEGVKLLRYRPKSRGMTSRIQKKTSLIKIMFGERVAGLRADNKPKKEESAKNIIESKPENQIKKPEIKQEIGKKRSIFGNIGRKIFQRKSI